MKNIHFCSRTIPVPPKSRGFSLLELLIVLAAMSSVAAMGYVHFSSTTEAVKAAKLRQDVAALNTAVRTYLMSGGDLSTVADGAAVIAKLKTTASAAHRSTLAGLRGSMVDLRLRAVGNPGKGNPPGLSGTKPLSRLWCRTKGPASGNSGWMLRCPPPRRRNRVPRSWP